MQVCPVGAITQTRDGIVSIDTETCVGCGLCSKYCPMDMIHLDPDTKKAVKCELCQGEPACVAACPTGALEWVTPAVTAPAAGKENFHE
jgi:Fe-S-cluster-containing hydrogenase component 2